jgi:predicted metal-binding membrane protein
LFNDPERSNSLKALSHASLETVLRRDRVVVLTALGTVTVVAWAYVLHLAGQMNMRGMDMTGFRMAATAAGMVMAPAFQPWSAMEFAFTLAMWIVMMVGMMLPSAAPIILLYARVGRHAATQGTAVASTGWFLGGYILAWIGFSVLATAAQWSLDRAALLTANMTSASAIFGSLVLIAAGLYQWSPFKDRCLSQCQSPLQFIQHHGGFRPDPFGSVRLGVSHGTYCVGCCWTLMVLLFVGGVMNVLWISAIAILVLAEKVIPAGRLVPRIAGIIFAFAGTWLLLAHLL